MEAIVAKIKEWAMTPILGLPAVVYAGLAVAAAFVFLRKGKRKSGKW